MDNTRLFLLVAAFLLLLAAALAKPDLKSKNHYEVLGVEEDASLKEIRKQYKMLAKKYHPDKLPKEQKGNQALVKKREEQFNTVKTAYEELSDPAKRKKYDRQLQMEKNGFGGFRSEGHHKFRGDSMFGGDFFMQFDPFHNDDFGDSFFGSFGSQFMEPQVNRWSDHDDSDYHAQFHHVHQHQDHGHGQNCQVFVQRIGNTVRKTVQCF